MISPPVTLEELGRVADHVSEAQRFALTVQMLTRPGQPPERAAQATEIARKAAEEAGKALGRLSALGAVLSDLAPPPPIALEQLDTPDTRRLLYLLEHAQEVAERIDAARGRTVGDAVELPPGQSRGTDLAETISEIALRVRTEVQGPPGREGRE